MRKNFDIWTFIAIIGLCTFSLFNIFGINNKLFLNQFLFIIIGLFFFLITYKLKINFFRSNSTLFYLAGLTLLIITFIIGQEVRGSRRWLDFYFFKFQPSEFLKPFFIIYLADIFSEGLFQKLKVINYQQIISSLIIFIIPVLFIFKQPDLGNSAVYSIIYMSLIFFVGTPLRYFSYCFIFIFISTPLIWKLFADYQKLRIISFINPHIDPKGVSYNLIQSIITVGSGGFIGRGLGLGTQSKFSFLPENHTDFVFASLVEQFGFLGGIVVIILYFIIIIQLIRKIFIYQHDKFTFLFLVGVVFLLFSQIAINIGMNLGLLPITGITLPLISYGGSSIISTMIILGFTQAI